MSDNTFTKRRTTRLGAYGERLLFDTLAAGHEVVPYRPEPGAGPHLVDGFCARTKGGGRIWAVEVKTKFNRWQYRDTGIDINLLARYWTVAEQGYDLRLYFVDGKERSIYGGSLRRLLEPTNVDIGAKRYAYPMQEQRMGIIYFPLSIMTEVRKLTDEEVATIEELTDNAETRTGSLF